LERRGAARTIGLLDHMGYGNLGDAAIQDSVIANIRRRMPEVRLVGFSLVPDDTMKRHGIPCHPIVWSYPRHTAAEQEDSGSVKLKARLKAALMSERSTSRAAAAGRPNRVAEPRGGHRR
jgi:hypothetical protein